MLDNQYLILSKPSGESVVYLGVVCTMEESKALLHPDYWKEIPVGCKMIFEDTKLIHLTEDTMLIRKNNSRNFIKLC